MSNQDQVFKQHPSLKSYHKTSDGTAFYKKEHAQAHARGLKDKKVTEVVNPDPKSTPSAPAQKPTSAKPKKNGNKPNSQTNKGADDTLQPSNDNAPNLDDLTPMQKAKLRVHAIKKLDSVSEVEAALKGETAKSVIEAGQTRIKAIQEVDQVLDNKSNQEEE